MSLMQGAAMIYAVLTGVVILFHIAMALGAPWGHLTMGGKYPGRLQGRVRLMPVISGGMLALMAAAVLNRAGVIALGWPVWTFWIAVAVTGVTTLANLATPSRQERLLWGPVTVVMCLCLLVIVFSG